eukprot:CAMPEP_0117512336 /NCGR_PEP_ID=MMETSP0784-20121206/28978_1 /TAXON_ID=39447 /ORGANISM="" /LENGTH=473 /DNA_ID=CAMNT_0005308051 /DNA_START=405 /DNA_END=1823 /DNA_ORIENTATION=+
MSSKELRNEAKTLTDGWEPGNLSEAVEVLERSTEHVDGFRQPFADLRRLAAGEFCKQLRALFEAKASDIDAESAAFRSKADVNLGKEESVPVDSVTFFKNAGPMEHAAALIRELERTGANLSGKDCLDIRPLLDRAAKERADWAMAKGTHKHLQYALFSAGILQALKVKEVVAVGQRYKELRGLPAEWDVLKLVNDRYGAGRLIFKPKIHGTLFGAATMPGTTASSLQTLLDDTYKNKYTRDRKDGKVPNRLVLVHAQVVQNEQNWVEYMARKQRIKAEIAAKPLNPHAGEKLTAVTMISQGICKLPQLDSTVQEVWLWHGTTQGGAEGITSEDFRINLAGSGAGTLYGRGIYLAEMCSKSDEYTKEEGAEHYILLCRATLGRVFYNDEVKPNPNALEDCCLHGEYHSVLGDREKIRGTYREIMVYDDDQVYPEYIIRLPESAHSRWAINASMTISNTSWCPALRTKDKRCGG